LVLGMITAVAFTMGPIYVVVQFSYRLALIPDELQGRVNSVFRLIAFGGQPLGMMLAGIMLQAFGAVFTILVLSSCLALLTLATTFNPHVRNAPPLSEVEASQ